MAFSRLKRSPLFVTCALVLGMVSQDAWSWGFGRAQSSAVLGVSLDFAVGLRLEAGEAPPECLTADVTVGDIPLPRSAVSVVVDTASGAPSVRVRTSVAIDEPLVSVNLSAGCSSRVSRRFTLLADPPGHLAAPALASAEAVAATAAPAAAPTAPLPQQAPPPAAAATPGTTAPAPVVEPSPRSSTAPGATRSGAEPSSPQAKAAAQASSGPAPSQAPARGRTPDPSKLADASTAQPDKSKAPAVSRPRLQLDAPMVAAKPPMGGAKPAAVLAAEEAASAARAAASAAEARAAAMEKNIEALRQEAKANRESLARLTQALQEAQGASPTPLALWGALAGLGALSAFLLVRMRRMQREAGQPPWWSSEAQDEPLSPQEQEAVAAAQEQAHSLQKRGADAPVTAAAGLPQLETFESPAGATPRELPPLPVPEMDDDEVGAMERTQLLPPSASSVSAPIQGVSIEELLDLEQQVEFFTVLGQDDAALGLLVEHLRHTGGTYPLPYLKLLEIYRRKGDEESYERTRDRFNQRFNAVAPAWGAAPTPDRHLEDLPDVMLKIEQAWPRPVDAMALLENMLVRTEGGTLLELSALAEVLFLFTLARDLHEQEEGAAGPVDVLLPLDDFMDLPPAPAGRGPLAAAAAAAAAAVPQAAVSKDYPVTQFASSSFALLEEASRQPASQAAATDDGDHFDIPLGEPMFEPVFDEVQGDRAAGARELPRVEEPALSPPAWSGAIDLPSFDADEQSMGLPSSAAPSPASEPFGFDLSLPSEPSAGSPARSDDSEPLLEPLSFELPDLEEVPGAAGSKPDNASAVDLDISLDGLELEPMAPKLSPREEQAASNFGLFNDAPGSGKPR